MERVLWVLKTASGFTLCCLSGLFIFGIRVVNSCSLKDWHVI